MRWILVIAVASSPAYADMYKCQAGGKTVYQDTRCPNAKVVNNVNGKAPPLEDQINAMYRAASDRAKAVPDTRQSNSKRQKNERPSTGTAAPAGANAGNTHPQTLDKGDRYFSNDGSVIERPPGSSFSHDSRGNTYLKPEGSAFSYGKDGKTCFHYGDFANCK